MPYYRRNVYILSVTAFLASLSWQQVMPFLSDYLKELGARGAQQNTWTSIVFAMQSLAAIIMMPLWGKLGDTYGRKPMIIRAGLCLAGIYYGMSICQTPWQLAFCRFLNGALTGFIPGTFALVATNTPEEEAPKAMATVQACANVGLIIGPPLGAVLAGIFGYRMSMQVSGTAVLISSAVVWLCVQEPNKVVLVEKTSLLEDFRTALKSRVQVAMLLVVMLTWCFSALLTPYMMRHLRTLSGGAPDGLAHVLRWMHLDLQALVFAIPAVAVVLTARRWAVVGEKRGYDRCIMLGLLSGGAGAFILFFLHGIWAFAAVYAVMSVMTASIGPAISALTVLRVDESFRGRAFGIQQSAGTIGSFVSYLAAGPMTTRWDLRAPFMAVGIIFLAGSVGFRSLSRQWKHK